MAVITNKEILERINKGEITFTPALDSFQLHAHSVDLRLGFTFMVPKLWQVTAAGREALHIDHYDKQSTPYFDVLELEQGQFFDILPNEYVLVSTLESVKIPNDIMAVLYPRSSTNRRGLAVDLSGIVDAGYEGQLIVPIRNNTRHQTIRLYPGERICQLTFEELSQPVVPRLSRYHRKDVIEGVLMDVLPNEREVESELVKQGKIEELKTAHPLKDKA
jgi:dCTP deaminase